MRGRGLEALGKWICEDEGVVREVGESGVMEKCIEMLGSRTIENRGRTMGVCEKREEDEMKDSTCSSMTSTTTSVTNSMSSELCSKRKRGGRRGEEEEGKEEEGEEEEEKEEEEEGVSVEEKRAMLGIVLEVVEGGGWKGSYSELEEVVGRLEEEGEKEWRERKRKRGGRDGRGMSSGMEWREMGRLAREVGWEIEKRKKMEGKEGDEGDGCMLTLSMMKKNLTEEKKRGDAEKKRADEEERKKEEEKLRADEEKRLKEEEKKGREEEKRLKEEEQRNREEEQRRAEEEKEKMEERIRNLEQLVNEMKYPPITSLDGTTVTFPQNDGIQREGNTIIHHGSTSNRNCFIGGVMTSVCNRFLLFLYYSFLPSFSTLL